MMRKLTTLIAVCAACSAFSSAQAASPTSSQVCAKMIADGRANGQTKAQCMCSYRVADAVFDDDIKVLLFDAWFTGKNNMAALEKLPKRARVKKQFKTMERTLKKNCPS